MAFHICVCSFQAEISNAHILKRIEKVTKVNKLSGRITYIQIPGAERTCVELPSSIGGLILLHSIRGGRFLISDSPEAPYDTLLPYFRDKVGKTYYFFLFSILLLTDNALANSLQKCNIVNINMSCENHPSFQLNVPE